MIVVPLTDVRDSPLYYRERGLHLPWWKRGPIPLGLALFIGTVLCLVAIIGIGAGFYTPWLGMILLACYAIFAIVWEMRVQGALLKWVESRVLLDLYMTGQSPELILASFLRAQAANSLIGFTPIYLLLMIVMMTVWVSQGNIGAILIMAFIFSLIIIISIVRLTKNRDQVKLNVQSVQWVCGYRSLAAMAGRYAMILPIVVLPFMTAGGYFMVVFNVCLSTGVIIQIREQRKLKKMTTDQVRAYIEAFIKGENPDPRDFVSALQKEAPAEPDAPAA